MRQTERRRSLGITATRAEIQNILRLGHEREINRGGLYDARSGCVNLWCSPEDRPAGWNTPIEAGGLDHPRAYVGDLSWEWDASGSGAELVIEAEPYELLDAAGGGLSQDTWEAVLEWLQAKALALVEDGRLAPARLGTRCPFCGFILPEGRLINELIDHIHAEHPGRKVTGLVLGGATPLQTVDDSYPLPEALE